MTAGPETNSEIKVWDPLVRLFHWSLAAAFFIASVVPSLPIRRVKRDWKDTSVFP